MKLWLWYAGRHLFLYDIKLCTKLGKCFYASLDFLPSGVLWQPPEGTHNTVWGKAASLYEIRVIQSILTHCRVEALFFFFCWGH